MKNFLVINLSCLGDVLLTDALCQNIKREYPGSNVVFMVNKPFYEVAKYMQDVDEVVCFDKKGEHKGLKGLVKFLRSCKLKNIDTAFIIYGNDRGILLSWLLGAKNRISGTDKITRFLLTKHSLETDGYKNMQDLNANFLKALTGKKAKPVPMKYNVPNDGYIEKLTSELNISATDELIGLCPISSSPNKDLQVEVAAELINNLSKSGKKVIITGAGDTITSYVSRLRELNCGNFIDLTNKTSISQLGAVIKRCDSFISVDTGAMHMACAIGTPLIALFFVNDENLWKWAPKDFYNHILMTENITAENIIRNLEKLNSQPLETTV